ncbi:hypothetical protein [Azospirillum sp. ST 5-10]|uniref:hypothetical protein n=1 Tax=unclassified Azospirillum TaxID=2630922 RepID=UPI003F49C30A
MSLPTSAQRPADYVQDGGTARLHLAMAVVDCDHVRDVTSGLVRPDGIVLTPLLLPIEEIFFRFLKNREFDVSEMSTAKFVTLQANGGGGMVGIPVFPSRVFRHSAVYVRADRGIVAPKDLEGRTVGIPEWAQTAGIYARGFLKESYGVDLAAIRWVQAGVNQPGRGEKVEFTLPAGVRYESRPEASLNEMLLSGAIDAAISARPPASFIAGDPRVRRLFDDPRGEEMRYHADTGIFPIMHVLTMRQAVFERHPWAAMSLLKAFEEAKRRSVERMVDVASARVPLPWAASLATEVVERFGGDPWPYGVDANRTTLDAFCRYAHDQGLTGRRLTADDLFPAEVRAAVRV